MNLDVLIGRVTVGRRSMTQLAKDLLKQMYVVYRDTLKLTLRRSWGLVQSYP